MNLKSFINDFDYGNTHYGLLTEELSVLLMLPRMKAFKNNIMNICPRSLNEK
jgi:hypothetical protein